MTIKKIIAIIFMWSLSTGSPAQTWNTYSKYGLASLAGTNLYWCPDNVPPEVSSAIGGMLPNVRISPTTEDSLANRVGGVVSEINCLDLSKEPGAAAVLKQREKHHAELILILTRQAVATEKLAAQMDVWMRKAEQDLRAAVNARFNQLPVEILQNPTYIANQAALRKEILDVSCGADRSKCD